MTPIDVSSDHECGIASAPHSPAIAADPAFDGLLQQMHACRSAGKSLPGAAYTSRQLFAADVERAFLRQWLFAGHACEIPSAGDYFVFNVAEESVIVLRDEAGGVRAFVNICRHRGSVLCREESGNCRRLVCPYHQWTYDLHGRLASARWMGDDFRPDDYPLLSLPVAHVAGLIYVCLSEAPPDFTAAWESMTAQFQMNDLDHAQVCCRLDYTIRANWKIVFENNRECYHCRGGHPEFCLSNYDVGVNGDRRANAEYEQGKARIEAVWQRLGAPLQEVNFPNGAGYRIARFPLKAGFVTESLDGTLVAPLMGRVPESGIGSLRIITLPNSWIHVNCDYTVTTRLTPVDPETTLARVTFLVDRRAQLGVDCDPARVAAVWKATSEQDWELCERMQAGVRSRLYRPGPYSKLVENGVAAFVDWYLAQLG